MKTNGVYIREHVINMVLSTTCGSCREVARQSNQPAEIELFFHGNYLGTRVCVVSEFSRSRQMRWYWPAAQEVN